METRPDGVRVLIRGETKKDKDEVVRGLLDVVGKMVWKRIVATGGSQAMDGKKPSE